jgi:hypothetical protein
MPPVRKTLIALAVILALVAGVGCATTHTASMPEDPLLTRSAAPWLPWYDSTTDSSFARASSGARDTCHRSESIQIPRADLPATADLLRLASCDSKTLYYGFAQKPDYVRARECAYLQRADGSRNPISGSVVLAMIYANGAGVNRNLPLATKFACEAGGAPAEIDARIGHLEAMAATAGAPREPFDFCDDITSGHMQGVCAGIAATFSDVRRGKEIARIAVAYTTEQQAALAALQHAAANYFNEHATNEVDLSGTGRGAFWIQDIQGSWDGFLRDLQTLEGGQLPAADTGAAERADARLSATYQRVLAKPSLRDQPLAQLPPPWMPVIGGTISRQGIRTDQGLWLSYRAAWLHLAALRKPALAPSAVRLWITGQRLDDLGRLLAR